MNFQELMREGWKGEYSPPQIAVVAPQEPDLAALAMQAMKAPLKGNFSSDQRQRVRTYLLARDGNLCHWCKKEMALEDITIEHILQKSKGGTNALGNLALACAPCNHGREAKTLSKRAKAPPQPPSQKPAKVKERELKELTVSMTHAFKCCGPAGEHFVRWTAGKNAEAYCHWCHPEKRPENKESDVRAGKYVIRLLPMALKLKKCSGVSGEHTWMVNAIKVFCQNCDAFYIRPAPSAPVVRVEKEEVRPVEPQIEFAVRPQRKLTGRMFSILKSWQVSQSYEKEA